MNSLRVLNSYIPPLIPEVDVSLAQVAFTLSYNSTMIALSF